MKTRKTWVIMFSFVLMACAPTQETARKDKHPEYAVHAGVNMGGFVESRGTTENPEARVDAYTGATRPGINAGARVMIPLGKHALESGLDIMLSRQELTYRDEVLSYNGKRSIATTQVMVPLTFNLRILSSVQQGGLLQVKFGGLLQANMPVVGSETGRLPQADFSLFSGGFTMGLSTTPFHLKNGGRIGVYGDIYRGSQFYFDPYNTAEMEEPGSAFYRVGIRYMFPTN